MTDSKHVEKEAIKRKTRNNVRNNIFILNSKQ